METAIVIAAISLVMTIGVYFYAAWRHFRAPRFWITAASAVVEDPEELDEADPDDMAFGEVTVDVAFVGGGRPRNILNVEFAVPGWLTMGTPTRSEVIPIPAELAGKFTPEFLAGGYYRFIGPVHGELLCELHIDTGDEKYVVPFNLKPRKSGDARWILAPISGVKRL